MRMLNTFMLAQLPDELQPEWPGEDKGVSITFSLDVEITGHNQRITFSVDVVTIGWFEIYNEEELEEVLYRELTERISPELAHNYDAWQCCGCARRAAVEFAWFSIYTELEKKYNRCSLKIAACCAKCAPKIRKGSLEVMKEHTQSGVNTSVRLDNIPRPAALGAPSGACLVCHKEAEAETEAVTMARCGKCKLVRYCGAACQKEDWARHKTVCSKIKNVCRGSGKEEQQAEKTEMIPSEAGVQSDS
ncbi:hypothetical protein C8R46DRAFT_1038815 [Mycena filopes]|nr:hypothetical protein C8R46DRAFT_1038815 [Mycena filopes]